MPYNIIIGRDDADKKRFGDKGLIYLGKGYVKMGQYTSLSNPILMDIARSHVILVSGKRGCLTEEAMIFTDKGYKQIKDFNKKEDKVLSFNKEKKEFEWENAELLEYPISNESLIELELDDGRKLQLTKEHPLLLTTGNKLLSLMWIKAESLKENDRLLSIGKSFNDLIPISIKSIKEIKGINKVYDLSVDKNHSFIANGIISHNSGKSYSLATIAEQLSLLPKETADSIASLIFDTMGIFWTMKYKNEKEKELLSSWKEKPASIPVRIFIPFGYYDEAEKAGIPVDEKFSIQPKELKAEDWVLTFNLSITDPIAILIERIITKLNQNNKNYEIKDILQALQEDTTSSQENKNAALGLFEAASTWGVFSSTGTEISQLITPATTTVLDLSVYNSVGAFNVRALVIGLLSRKLFNKRMEARKKEELEAVRHGLDYMNIEKRKFPLIWLFIDEVQEFIPNTGKTAATDALIQLLREGRQPGISLVMATQQPGALARDAITQSDIVISHRITAAPDIQALNNMMQSYLTESIKKYLDDLPNLKGSAIILDDNSERIYPMRIKPRLTWHGGEAPTAVKVEKRE